MARYVMCPECIALWQAEAAKARDHGDDDDVTERYVYGTARTPMRCDGLCNEAIAVGQSCCALTVTLLGRTESRWEDDYLTPSG